MEVPVKTLHLMTQRDQPFDSMRKCCEICGLMLVRQPSSFWNEHIWTDQPELYEEKFEEFKQCRIELLEKQTQEP